MSSRQFFLSLLLVSIAIAAPLWIGIATAWPVSTDIIFYSTVLKAFSQQFWAGDLYPRWLLNVNDGYGSPVFIFYPPLTFYVGSLWEFLSAYDPTGLGRTVLTMQFAVIACGYSCYRWLRLSFSESEAMRGGLIYAGFPSLALVMYYDFGVSQLWAFALFPLLLLCAQRMAREGWRIIPYMSVAYGLLALTHLPSTLVFSGIPILYAAFLAAPNQRIRTGFYAFLAGLLGAAFVAGYLLPTRLNEEFITMSVYLKGNGDYSLNFGRVRNFVAIAFIALPLAGFFLELGRQRRNMLTPDVKFWLWIIAGLCFMVSYLSYPIWYLVKPLQYLQFPWRVLVAAVPAAVYISVRWLPYVKSKSFFLFFSAMVFGINGYVTVASLFFHSPKPLGDIVKDNLVMSQEYRTSWMQENGVSTFKFLTPALKSLPPASITKGTGTVEVTRSTAREIVVKADIRSKEAQVDLRRFYFPGWESSQPDVTIAERKALLALTVPKGTHEITLSLPWFKGEREGWIISAMALGIIITMLGLRCYRQRKPTQI